MKKLLLFLALPLLLSALSCTREGPPGPQGPAGPAGSNGTGPLVFSSTITLQPGDWVFQAPSYTAEVTWDALTPNIIDHGAVLVYWQVNPNQYTQLPVTFYQNAEFSTTVEYWKTDNTLTFWWTDSDQNQPTAPGAQTFKIVIIESTDFLSKTSAVDWSDYHAVKAYYNLKD
ncbi:MAG: hypothetical protein KF690_12270 [Bacteroidetes bacterium]|nr:hypothetical protein [Bacteroidota bacterium]